MKTIGFIFFAICIANVAFTQPYKLTASSEIELPKKSFASSIFKITSEEVCMVTTENSGFMGYASPKVEDTYFNYYKNISLQKSVILKPNIEGAKFIESFELKGKMTYTSMINNKEKKQAEIYLNAIDNNGNPTKSVLINTGHIKPGVINMTYYAVANVVSPNRKKIASLLLSESEKETSFKLGYKDLFALALKPNVINVGVADENGDLYYTKDISISAPSECERISIEDYKVNDNGDVFLLLKQYIEGKKEKVDGDVNYKIYLYILGNKGATIKKIPISIKNYFSGQPKLVISNHGTVYCGGFLSESVNRNFVGIYTLKLTAETDSFKYKITKITTSDINKFGSAIKYKDDEISKYFVLDRILETDDQFGIVAEYYNVITSNTSKGPVNTYVFRDIAYFMFSPNMELKDIAIIPKSQAGYNNVGYLSYAMILHNNMPYFIFNDNKKNIEAKEADKMASTGSYKNMAPVIVYKEDGKWVRKRLFEKEEVDENMLYTISVEQADNNNVFLPFEKKGKYVLGKLTFTQ